MSTKASPSPRQAGDGGPPPLLVMEGITKGFPGVQALMAVDLTLRAGEVLALVGENGAGKSTLIKVLGGAHRPDAGRILIDGEEVIIARPVDSQRAGVSIIYQEFNLVPGLTARENIFLGREPNRAGWIRQDQERAAAARLLAEVGVPVDLDLPCRDLSVAQQQALEIAKALSARTRIIVMDEPSATLTPQEVNRLFGIIRELKTRGIGVIYVSHRLNEIFAIADRVMVMRDGRQVRAQPVAEVNKDRLIEMMVGRKLENEFPPRAPRIGPPRLVARGLTRGRKVRDVSFCVRRGEVLALTGLVGAGRTETLRLIFGADRAEAGVLELDGRRLNIRNPREAIRAGICLLTEDRKGQGLVLGQSVRENFGLPNLGHLARFGLIRLGRERELCEKHRRRLGIRTPTLEQAARHLSGGNQQKLVLAKWLERNAEVILFDEPTRGIDVGAKYEIYSLMQELAAQGKAILMVSSELPEVLGMADRILVMHEGRISGEIERAAEATQEDILRLAVG